jgi:hypothetical protein
MKFAGRIHARRGRIALLSLLALGAIYGSSASSAGAANPDILNDGTGCSGQTQWLLTCATGGETGPSGNANFLRTAGWVNHDLTTSLSSILTDDDWDGTVDPTTVRGANAQRPTIDGGYPRSRFNVSYQLPTSNTGMSCSGFPSFSGTRRTDNRNARIAARDSANQTSGTSSSQIKFVAAGGCTGPEDFAYIDDVAASNFGNSLTPGQSDTFTYNGDDSDTTGNSDFNGVFWRLRNIRTGATTGGTLDCDNNGDNATKSTTVTFPDRGAWVVEAELRTGGGCGQQQNNGWWFALGSADVNSSAAPSLSLDSATTTVGGVIRPQWQQDFTVRAQGLVDPDAADQGGAQILEWDLNNNTGDGVSGYEETNYAGYGDILDVGDTTGTDATQRNVDSSPQAPGLYTLRSRVTDNGAGDAADTIRRQGTDTVQYRVDAAPIANAQTVTTDTGASNVPITLTGSDPDGDSLTYSITDQPDNGTLGGSGASRTYTPAAGFAGTDTFTFQVDDGFGRFDTAVVTVNVRPGTTITDGPDNPTNSTSATFEFTSNATGATFECSIDNAAFTAVGCTSPRTYTGLSEGPHNFKVRAVRSGQTDATPAEYNWTIDLTPPGTSLTPPLPTDPTNSTSATFNYTSTGGGNGFQCRLDGDAPGGTGWVACGSGTSGSKTYTGLSDATHVFEVRATDAAGNADQSPASHTWRVDTDPAATTIDTGSEPPNPSNSQSNTFTFSADETGTFQCRMDGDAPTGTGWVTCGTGTSGSKEYTGLPEGNHTFEVRLVDQANNTGPADSYNWRIDITKPVMTIAPASQPADPTNVQSANFTWTASEESSFECRLDGEVVDGGTGWVACNDNNNPANTSGSKSYSGLAEGDHTFEVRGTDLATNVGDPDFYDWEIDLTDPETTINDQPANPSNDTSPTFEFSSNESPAGFQCRLDGDAPGGTGWQTCGDTDPDLNSGSITYTDVQPGEHTFEVRATDEATNTDETPDSYTWVLDLNAPEVNIDAGSQPANPTNVQSANFTWTASEASTYECRLDGDVVDGGTGWVACNDNNNPAGTTGAKSYTGLFEGDHTFEVRSTDLASNLGPTDSYTWEIDITDPETTIEDEPPNPSNDTSPTFEFSSNESPSTFECRLDGDAPGGTGWQTCGEGDGDPDEGSITYTGVTQETSHTFEVRATDEATNTDESPASYTWVVDTTAPVTTIDNASQPADPTNVQTANFTWTANEAGDFECRLDGDFPVGSGWVACGSGTSGSKSYTGLTEGSHTFQVRSTDAATNTGTGTDVDSYTWRVDVSPPVAEITGQPNNPSNDTTPSFSFNSSENPSEFECRLDGDAPTGTGWEDCGTGANGTKDYTGVGEGLHTFEVRAADAATNQGGADSYTWLVDTTPPTVNITNAPSGTVASDSATIEFVASEGTVTCKLDGNAPAPCNSPRTYNGLSDGPHTVIVEATDTAGNPGSDSATWTVDTTGPDTVIDSGPPAYSSPAATFNWHSDDPNATYECSLDGAPWQPCTSPKDYSALDQAEHHFEVRGTDAVGNVEDVWPVWDWIVGDPPAQVLGEVSASPQVSTPKKNDPIQVSSKGRFRAGTIQCPVGPCEVLRKKGKVVIGGVASGVAVTTSLLIGDDKTVSIMVTLPAHARKALDEEGKGLVTLKLFIRGENGGELRVKKVLTITDKDKD